MRFARSCSGEGETVRPANVRVFGHYDRYHAQNEEVRASSRQEACTHNPSRHGGQEIFCFIKQNFNFIPPIGDHAARPKKYVSPAERRRRQARAHKIKLAFVASAELRPMAQQLSNLRTPAAYAGVTSFAHSHSGEAAAAAYLALGHAYLLDKRYADAVADLHQARKAGEALSDYSDFLAARAYHESDQEAQAEALLKGFKEKYPDSIFVDEVPELEANVLLDLHDPAGAKRVIEAAASDPAAGRAGYQLAAGMVAQALNQNQDAVQHLQRTSSRISHHH